MTLHTSLVIPALLPGQAIALGQMMRNHNCNRVLDSVRTPLLLGPPDIFLEDLCGWEDVEQWYEGCR